ncbi:hypothetical protein BCR37DRAFT_377007 [Protomyces lactucae-debilis]|uniref:Uncharacterized protein n=1 Tax=Protomyces lactucae-debilis TaxID=2754530 RepID=A0A1Y2FQW8_PROLT|nr:uncharacterized protein BCR37DRAFT_377007 [Protomyces lactucae-debilis]ORY86391.1 hypothetical protein BCR37DRAFT_377007 [Protomyces lactucae-debilis]
MYRNESSSSRTNGPHRPTETRVFSSFPSVQQAAIGFQMLDNSEFSSAESVSVSLAVRSEDD